MRPQGFPDRRSQLMSGSLSSHGFSLGFCLGFGLIFLICGGTFSATRAIASVETDALVATLRQPMNYLSHERKGQVVDIKTSKFPVRLEVLAEDLVKVRYANGTQFGPEVTSSVVSRSWAPVNYEVLNNENQIVIRTAKIQAVIKKAPVRISFFDNSGKILLESDGLIADAALDTVNKPPHRSATERIVIGERFKMQPDEHFYGLGLKVRQGCDKNGANCSGSDQTLDWRGRKRDWDFSVSHMGNRFEGADGGANGNVLIPFFWSTKRYGFFLDTPYKTYWEFNQQNHFYVKMDCDTDWEAGRPLCQKSEMRYYVIGSGTPQSILRRYSQLTGPAILPPRWMFGYLQSNYGYRNWHAVHETVDALRRDQFPVDAVFLDLQWFGGVPGMHDPNGNVQPQFSGCDYRRIGDFKWSGKNPFNFSDPQQNLKDLKQKGVKTVLIEEGYFDVCTGNFNEAQSKGYLARKDFQNPTAAARYAHDNDPASDETSVGWAGQVGMIDTTQSEARRWFWERHLPFFKDGAAGFWTDLGEPEKFRWWWKYGSNLWHQDIHNIWDLNRAKSFFEGYSRDLPNERPFLLSRSGYAGSQRYGVGIWSADTPSRLKWAAAQPGAQANLAISGINYFTSDIGGFGGYPVSSPEQYTRWLQFGLFSSLARSHGNTTIGFHQERQVHPNLFPEPYKTINRNYIQWRYALIPYFYTHARETYDTGMPMIRALPLIEPQDPNVHDLGSQYLLGPSLLIAPILEGDDNNPHEKRNLYLPSGKWVDLHDGKSYQGPQWLHDFPAPLHKMPMFARLGSVLPKAPVRMTTQSSDWDATRILEIYPDPQKEVLYQLYDDDGVSNGYQREFFARTRIQVQQVAAGIEVKIGPMRGNYQGKPQSRKYQLELHLEKAPQRVLLDGKSLPFLDHQPSEAENGVYFQTSRNRLFVNADSRSVSEARTYLIEF